MCMDIFHVFMKISCKYMLKQYDTVEHECLVPHLALVLGCFMSDSEKYISRKVKAVCAGKVDSAK